jgi:hypothetical protein
MLVFLRVRVYPTPSYDYRNVRIDEGAPVFLAALRTGGA